MCPHLCQGCAGEVGPAEVGREEVGLGQVRAEERRVLRGEEVTGWEREESVVFMAIVIESVGKGYERDAAEIEPRSSRDRAESKPRSSGELGRES